MMAGGNVTFIRNRSPGRGGAICLVAATDGRLLAASASLFGSAGELFPTDFSSRAPIVDPRCNYRKIYFRKSDPHPKYREPCALRDSAGLWNNSAWYGGALYAQQSALTLRGTVRLARNNATSGGSLYVASTPAAGPLVLDGAVEFSDNTAITGGAVTLLLASVQMACCAGFAGNRATAKGGAIYSELSSTITASGAIFMQNTAGSSG